jgi:hypothetical protein
MVCASFEHIYSVYNGETPLRFFNTRKRKGCFREEQDTQIKIYTIHMNNGGMEESMVLTSEPLSRLDQHSDLNHPRPLPSSISGNDCEEGGGGYQSCTVGCSDFGFFTFEV